MSRQFLMNKGQVDGENVLSVSSSPKGGEKGALRVLSYHIWFFDEKGEAIETYCRAAVDQKTVLTALEWWLNHPMHQYRENGVVRKVSLFTFEVCRHERAEEKTTTGTAGEPELAK